MLVGIVAVIAAVLNGHGGFTEALAGLASVSDPAVSETPGIFASFFGPDPVGLLSVVLLTSLGTWGLPQMVQKFYAIKDEKSISKGTIISTLFALVVAGGCYFLGGFGRLYDVDVAANGFDAIIPTMLEGLPDILVGVVIILVLSASMSTLSSLVMTSASTLTLDFINGTIVKKMSEKAKLTCIRVFIGIFIAISVVIAAIQYKSNVTFIAQLMGISWGALAGSFLAPFLYGLYMKRASKLAAWFSFGFGTIVMTLNLFFKSVFPAFLQSPINCGAFTMIVGLIAVPVISLFTKPDKEKVDAAFSCYEEKVTVSVKQTLGEGK
jgi:SSS family solute:Na+ symporter